MTRHRGAEFGIVETRVQGRARHARLVEWRERVAAEKRAAFASEAYWGRPVPSLGDVDASVLIVGPAPAAHGANRTGRMFTGDRSGDWLFAALHRAGYASQASSVAADDGLTLTGVRITATCHCAPPANKPTPAEIRQCNGHLKAELAAMPRLRVIVALGAIAHQALLRAYGLKPGAHAFGHNVSHALPDGRLLVDSYHCSGYNWRTGRLSRESFEAVFDEVNARLG